LEAVHEREPGAEDGRVRIESVLNMLIESWKEVVKE
jgi:hypothetical protein